MSRQLMTKEMTIRVIGEDGEALYPLIEPDDLEGNFDYKASVLPSIAGQQDVNKKQAMDLYQLLMQFPPDATGVDPRKLTSRLVSNWNWSIDSISATKESEGPQQPQAPGEQGGAAPEGVPPEILQAIQAQQSGEQPAEETEGSLFRGKFIPRGVMKEAMALLRKPGEGASGGAFSEASSPINLLQGGGIPPTAPGINSGGNLRGLNRSGKVNTNISQGNNASTESALLNRSFNIQR